MHRPTTSTSFEQQIEAYSATSKSIASSSNWRDRLGSWPIYAAATASALACSTSASAGIIYYSGPVNLTASIPASHTSAFAHTTIGALNVKGDLDRAYSSHPPRRFAGAFLLDVGTGAASFLGIGSTAKRLSAGANISAGAGQFSIVGELWDEFNSAHTAGQWSAGNETGFAGLKIRTSHGAHDYGWLRVRVQAVGTVYPDEITLIDYAYNETAGQSIDAGQEASTPEPATKAMMLVACGFAGVLAWRRRKASV